MPALKDSRKQHLKVNQAQLDMDAKAQNSFSDDVDYDSDIVATQQKLEQLRQQQELVARQKQEREELALQKEEFIDGQISIVEKLNSTITAVDRELFEMRQEIEDLEQTRKCFAEHLQKVDGINSQSWSNDEMKHELNRAISMLDHAEDEYDEALSYFSNSNHSTVFTNRAKTSKSKLKAKAVTSQGEFAAMCKQGLAFNLPIFALGTIALIAYLTR